MADERDPEVSRRYRNLGAEEPPRELDQAILSAARRAVDKPHAPLVTPSGRHRWYFSLGAAAVIVLTVAVTYHMQQEVPDPDSVVVAPGSAARPETAERAEEPPREPAAPTPPVLVPDPRSDSAEGAASPPGTAAQAQRRAEPGPAPAAKPMQAPVVETPERMLERIVELRKAGKYEEADGLYAEFRRRYPDYRLPDAVLEKIEKK